MSQTADIELRQFCIDFAIRAGAAENAPHDGKAVAVRDAAKVFYEWLNEKPSQPVTLPIGAVPVAGGVVLVDRK